MFQIRTIGLLIVGLLTIATCAMEVPEDPSILVEILSGQVQTKQLNLRPYTTDMLTELKQYLEQQKLTQSGNFKLLYTELEKELRNRTQAISPSVMQNLYLVPTEQSELNQLGLCPIFPRNRAIIIDSERGRKESLLFPIDLLYTKLKTWERSTVDKDYVFSCPIDDIGGDRYLMQLACFDQHESPKVASNCGSNSIYTSVYMLLYAKTGNKKYLSYINNLKEAEDFLDTYGCTGRGGRLTSAEQLNIKIDTVISDFKEINKGDIQVIENIFMLDKNARDIFGGSHKEITAIDALMSKVKNGLTQENFCQAIIVGDAEQAQMALGTGHYFAFIIIKANNKTQYVVLDTVPENYYLYYDSYDYQKVLYLIGMLSQGKSTALSLIDTPLNIPF